MKTEKQKSPVIGDRVIKKLLNEEEYLEKTGDIDEVYFELLESDGRSRAALWYWSEIIKTIISILLIRFAGSIAMFKNYLKIAFRNIIRNKVYSLLNILGLSIGIAGCVLILIYVKYEFSFDQYHENPDSIYRVYMEFPDYYRGTNLWAGTCGPLAKTLVEEYPEVIAAARLETKDEVLISYGAKKFMEDNIIFADPEIFDVFSFELLEGNPKSVLDDPYSIIVSEKMAEKYFGKENPIGKILNFDIKYDFRITGILKNMPANSHFNMDFIIPFQVHKTITGIPFSSWYQSGLYTYILLEENASPVELEAKLPALLNKYWDGRGDPDDIFHLQLMTDIHLHSNMLNEFQANNDIKYIYLLTGIAVLIIFIACFNYMNLATARSFHRAKEVGIRKVVGAQRKQLIRQFFGESFILTIFGFILALAMVYLVLPEFNSFVERDLTLTVKDIINNAAWLVLLIISVSIISGSYPALFITSFKPVLVLKGALKGSSRGELLRNILVVSQFVITITLIISSIMIQQQLSFIKNKDLGLNKDRIVTVFLHNDQTRNNIGVVKNELTENPGIISVASSRALLFNGMSQGRADWPEKVDKEEFLPIYINSVDYDFLDMYGIEITEGRNFSREFASDAGGAFLLNESAIEMIGFEDPIGRDFIQAGHFGRNDGKIVGVMKDFHFQSLRLNIEPIQLILNEEEANRYLSIKIKAENIPETLGFIEDKISGFSPNYPFEYTFFDEIFDRAYKTEQKLGQIMSVFSTLAIIVACLGLLGLSSFITEQRMKEIGIRKVLGASFNKIIFLLSGEFSKWIILANIISIPIAYFTMNKWLENYAYKIEISPITFLMGALAVILIASVTVSFHSVRAALTKTVNSLRYE